MNVPKAGADETKKKKRAPAKEKRAKGGKGKKKSAAGNAEANKENVEGEEGAEGEVKEGGEGGGEVKTEKKKTVKKSIPGWATLSEETKKRLVHSKVNITDAHLPTLSYPQCPTSS